MRGFAEYIWLDGTQPTQQMRSKTKVIEFCDYPSVSLSDFPTWNFDGSSTNQSSGDKSDLVLKPVNFCQDPLRGEGCYLVLCEVFLVSGAEHSTNTRCLLRQALDKGASALEPWFGFEQEYTLYKNGIPLGWPTQGTPGPQGPYYCGVGTGKVDGRELVDKHARACLSANLMIYGTNAEVLLGQWEFQVGHRDFMHETADALTVCDHLWLARWLLHRLGESSGIVVSLANKPIPGDWNGSGCHTNVSTKATRSKDGLAHIQTAITALSKKHKEHVALYGVGLAERLTGRHETCSIHDFRSGASDRGASVRIPNNVITRGYGYFEDRRPGANIDPYLVASRILSTLADIEVEGLQQHNQPIPA